MTNRQPISVQLPGQVDLVVVELVVQAETTKPVGPEYLGKVSRVAMETRQFITQLVVVEVPAELE